MLNNPTRRFVCASLVALPLATPVWAVTKGQAEALIERLTKEVLGVINSGKRGQSMYNAFERIFKKYADVPIIARSSLGVAWRSASAAQQRAYVDAFSGYMARKYGKRFNEFVGSKIEVKSSRKAQRGYLVVSVVDMKGYAPFLVEWQVSDASGRLKMFNLYIEGINMLQSERAEIGAMLDKSGGNIDKLVARLRKAG